MRLGRRIPILVFACSLAPTTLVSCANPDRSNQAATVAITTTSTVPLDLSGVKLRGVQGSTTTTLPATPGLASIAGRITGPGGDPVQGATVLAWWYATNPPTEFQALTTFDGTYTLTGLHGGRWRVKAFLVPDQSTPKAQAFFMKTDERKTLDLGLNLLSEISVNGATAPDPPVVGTPTELTVQAFRRSVDARGQVSQEPARATALSLVPVGDWHVTGSKTKLTGFDGAATWTMICETEGLQSLAIDAGGQRTLLPLTACTQAEPSSTTTSTKLPGA